LLNLFKKLNMVLLYSKLKLFSKSLYLGRHLQWQALVGGMRFSMTKVLHQHALLPPLTSFDINCDEMADIDEDAHLKFRSTSNQAAPAFHNEKVVSKTCCPTVGSTITPLGLSSAVQSSGTCSLPCAPCDINGWEDEEEAKECTVEFEQIEKLRQLYEMPPIPKQRTGVYEFKGIKVILPKGYFSPGTYKYRLTEEDQYLSDDTRVCVFEPKSGTAAARAYHAAAAIADALHKKLSLHKEMRKLKKM